MARDPKFASTYSGSAVERIVKKMPSTKLSSNWFKGSRNWSD